MGHLTLPGKSHVKTLPTTRTLPYAFNKVHLNKEAERSPWNSCAAKSLPLFDQSFTTGRLEMSPIYSTLVTDRTSFFMLPIYMPPSCHRYFSNTTLTYRGQNQKKPCNLPPESLLSLLVEVYQELSGMQVFLKIKKRVWCVQNCMYIDIFVCIHMHSYIYV